MKLTFTIWVALSLIIPTPSNIFTYTSQGHQDQEFPQIEGFKLELNYPVYVPGTLWDYINGAADSYLSYHFQELRIGEYSDQSGESIKVEVYRHMSRDYAYGIYCSERFPDYNFIDIGIQGYAESGLVNFLIGEYYVKVVSSSETPDDKKLRFVASEISKWLDDGIALPGTLEFFPERGKIEMSECFIASNFLGHEFLKDAYTANYSVENENFSIFIFHRDDPEELVDIVRNYLNFAKSEVPEKIEDGFYGFEDRYNGLITLHLTGNYLFGFLDCKDKELVKEYSELINAKITE